MDLLKEIKKNRLIGSIACFLMGAALFLRPAKIMKIACFLIAAVILIHAATSFFEYVKQKKQGYTGTGTLISAIIGVILGLFVLGSYRLIMSFIPFVLGIFVIFSGINKLEDAMLLKKADFSNGVPMIFAIINIVLGLILILNPFGATALVFQVGGVMLMYSGVTDIISQIHSSRKTSGTIDVEIGKDGVYKNRRF